MTLGEFLNVLLQLAAVSLAALSAYVSWRTYLRPAASSLAVVESTVPGNIASTDDYVSYLLSLSHQLLDRRTQRLSLGARRSLFLLAFGVAILGAALFLGNSIWPLTIAVGLLGLAVFAISAFVYLRTLKNVTKPSPDLNERIKLALNDERFTPELALKTHKAIFDEYDFQELWVTVAMDAKIIRRLVEMMQSADHQRGSNNNGT